MTDKEALKLALEALEESLGYVEEEVENAQRLYGQYPTRQARIQGLKDDARKHMNAITAVREALAEQPAQQQEPIYQMQMMDGKWIDQAKHSYEYNKKHGHTVRIVYAAPHPAQQQEPVAWMDGYRNIYSLEEKAAGCEDAVIPLVTATLQHWSDCAVHNEPAYPAGKCDCGGYTSPQPAQQQEPWGACVSGRVFVGGLPEHARKLSEDEGVPIQWLYTSPPASKPWVGLTKEDRYKAIRPLYCDDATAALAACNSNDEYEAIEALLREKNA